MILEVEGEENEEDNEKKEEEEKEKEEKDEEKEEEKDEKEEGKYEFDEKEDYVKENKMIRSMEREFGVKIEKVKGNGSKGSIMREEVKD